MTEHEIRVLQVKLGQAGFDPGPVDGIFGPHTRSAVIAFKRSVGLRARDYVGPLTLQALDDALSPELPFKQKPGELPWLLEIRKVMDLHENFNNRELRDWLASDGYALGDPAVFPWCGDAVETPLRLALPSEPIPNNPYWALNWQNWGVPTEPTYGCVISISRKGGGHVAFLVGEDQSRYYCLGGNQSNRINVAPISKSRFTAKSFRWPSTYPRPKINLPYMSTSDATSTNEA